MNLFTELIVRGVLVIALNDAIILYVMKKRAMPITAPLIIALIVVTSVAYVINIWYCLKKHGLL